MPNFSSFVTFSSPTTNGTKLCWNNVGPLHKVSAEPPTYLLALMSGDEERTEVGSSKPTKEYPYPTPKNYPLLYLPPATPTKTLAIQL